MNERFSDRARHAMALANLEAGKLGHGYLAPGHIMLGLIAEGECVATSALRVLDVDLEEVRKRVASLMEKGDGGTAISSRAHTKEMKEVIARAIEEARGFGHRYVGTEHLILSLCQQVQSVPSRILKDLGLGLEDLRSKVLAMVGTGPDYSQDFSHLRHGEFEWVHQQELAKVFRSPKFWHTMILAVDSANRAGAGELEPEHLLLALLRDNTSEVAKILGEKGVTADWVRGKLGNGKG
jgi:ATP-dependent Clp protease ATP-binding subunit ClpA